MPENNSLAERFEANRGHLRAVAYRMLGSASEADDAVQEAWLRMARTDTSDVGNLGGWLTTVVARVCLDMLRTRKARREDPLPLEPEMRPVHGNTADELELADSVGMAMLVVLETLGPAERVAFVLHDMFNLSFDVIAPIVKRSPAAARQLASRARRRIQGDAPVPEADRARQQQVVAAFLSASRSGDFSALLAVLDPAVVVRADAAAVEASLARASSGAPPLAPELHGAEAVVRTFSGRAQAAQLALVDGHPGLVFAPGGQPRVVFDFVVENDRIVEISLIADAEAIGTVDLQMIGGR
jgi:RNA polymerase sigma-70 factor (ECF subfamily)